MATAAREGRRHTSPNAGFPEAAFAGALAVKLGGASRYGGTTVVKLDPVPERGQARMLSGSTREMVAQLVALLRDEAKVL